MADMLIKMKTGTISKLESKKANGTPEVDLDRGSVYFAVDTDNLKGKIVYDAPIGANGAARIVMDTEAEKADIAKEVIIDSKTYTNVIASANNNAGAGFFYAKVRGNTFDDVWHVKVRITAWVPGSASNASLYYTTSEYDLWGMANTYAAYKCQNAIRNTSYRPVYYNSYFRINSTGYNNGGGGWIGFNLYASTNPTSSSYKRTVKVELLEYQNCTVELQDSLITPGNLSNISTSNYYASTTSSFDNFDCYNSGLRETGDDNTIEDLTTYFAGKTGSIGIWATSLFMEDSNGTYQNICTASNGTATFSNRTTAKTKKANPNGFKVGGKVFYSTTTYAANTNISGWGVIYTGQSIFDSRYAFNTELVANSLTPYKPIYLMGTIGADGLYYLDSTQWWTQTPTTQGKVYVLVGGCYDSTTSNCRIGLHEHNFWYIYDGTKLVPYIYSYVKKDDLGDLLAQKDAMIFKGVISQVSDIPATQYEAGWTYKIGAFGTYADKVCEVGDLFICIRDWNVNSASNDDWMVIQSNLDNGLFKGLNTFADGQMLLADNTAGKVKAVDINPTINMTAGTSSAAPKFTISVGGQTSSAASIGTATTTAYGATKLLDAIDNTSTSLAATANAVKQAYDIGAAAIPKSTGTAKGDIIYFSASGTPTRLAVGTNGQVLKVNSSGIPAWASDSDSHYTTHLYAGASDGNTNAATTNGNTYLIITDNTTARDRRKIAGTGATTVTSDANGNITINSTDTTYTFDGAYDASTNKAATVSTVTNAINALDGNLNNTTPGAGKTLTAFSQTDGKISATFGNISITKSQVSDFPTTMTPASHTHGKITNDGKIASTDNVTIANNDRLVISDASDSSILKNTSIVFDGSTTNKALTPKGTWETFNNYSLPLAASGTRGGIKIGYTSSGKNYAVQLSSEQAFVNVPWTDIYQNITLKTTTKGYITAVETAPTSTAAAQAGIADTGVYLTTTAGQINATSYKINEKSYISYDTTVDAIGFTFV